MVYLNKWTTTIPEEDKKIQYIKGVSYVCKCNICKNEAAGKKITLEQDLHPWYLQQHPSLEIFSL